MLGEALSFLNDALVQPFAAILLFRFHAVWLKAPMRNPAGEFIMAITDFIVLRVRRYVPAVRGLDTSTLLLALLTEFLYVVILWQLGTVDAPLPVAGLLLLAAVKLLKLSIYLLIITLIAEALLSWVNPHTPIAPLLYAINGPFLRPLRRSIPLVGNVDLSVLVLLILCQLILIIPVGGLEHAILRSL